MLTLLYEALSSKLGIVVQTSDPERTRMALYSERRKRADPLLDRVSICIPPFSSTELWLVRTGAKDAS